MQLQITRQAGARVPEIRREYFFLLNCPENPRYSPNIPETQLERLFIIFPSISGCMEWR